MPSKQPVESPGNADVVHAAISAFAPTQRESRWLIALVFAGIALRLMLLLFRTADLKTDPDAYVIHAETLLQTGGYNVPASERGPGSEHPTAFRPPLYPLLLASLKLTGLKMTTVITLINLFSGAVVIIATWWMSRVVGLRGRWPGIAAASVGLDPLLLRYSALPMTEVLSAALLSVAVLQLLKARLFDSLPDGDYQKQHRPAKSSIVAGVCFGLSGLCRPVALVTCAVLTVVQAAQLCLQRFFRRRHTNGSTPPPRSARLIALPALVAALVLLPWVIRNAVQFDRFIPATTHGGYTLLLGNNDVFYNEVVAVPGHPAWQSDSLDRWQQELSEQMATDGVDASRQADVDRWMYAQAISAIRRQPGRFLQACVFRWTRFWAVAPVIEPENSGPRWTSSVVAVWYSVLWFGLLGSLAFCVIHRAADIQLLWLAVLSFLLLHSFYWTNTRMRAPLMGILCVLAVVGWQYWWKLWNRRKSA